MSSQPSDKIVSRAKSAQALRLGQSGASGKRKRCIKGKSCGASCISHGKICLVDLPWVGQAAMKKLVQTIKKSLPKEPSFVPLSKPSFKTKQSREHIEEVYKSLLNVESTGNLSTIDGILKEENIKWENSFGQGVKAVGAGSFGSFASVPAERLGKGLSRFNGGVGVKAGSIGEEEVNILRKIGKLDLGPKLIGARLGEFKPDSGFDVQVAQGMVAMTKVPGTAYYKMGITEKENEAVWKSVAALHRAGIAHNDAHGGNILIDKAGDGKARFVDLGLSQNNVKAALSEALGAAGKRSYALDDDVFSGPSYSKISSNLEKVRAKMRDDGFEESSITYFLNSGIQNSLKHYNSKEWKSMSIGQANKYIDILYEGV